MSVGKLKCPYCWISGCCQEGELEVSKEKWMTIKQTQQTINNIFIFRFAVATRTRCILSQSQRRNHTATPLKEFESYPQYLHLLPNFEIIKILDESKTHLKNQPNDMVTTFLFRYKFFI